MQSVLKQSYPVREIIIIDDSSDVRFQERINDVTRLGAHIFLHRLPSHKGASAARNCGLDKAQGDLILFLDDDDLIHPQLLESNLAVFEQNPEVDIVTCLSKAFIDHSPPGRSEGFPFGGQSIDSSKVAIYPLNHPHYVKLERITLSSLLYYTLIINSCLVKRDCIKTVRFPEDLAVGEDTYFWMSLASQGCNFMLNRQSYAYVRFHVRSSRLKPDYDDAAIEFFDKLLCSGMLKEKEDVFLAHAYLVLRLAKANIPEMIRHLLFTLQSPYLILKYLRSYYSKEARDMRSLYRFLEDSQNPGKINSHDHEQA